MFKLSHWKKALLATTLMVAGATVQAHGFAVGDIAITHPYARPSLPGVPNGAAWFGIQNRGSQNDRIIGAKAAVSSYTEIHDMKLENDIMRMFRVDGIDIAAGQSITMGDGNKLHVMLLDLKQPLKVGDKFPMTIEFEKAGRVDVEVWVEAPRKSGMAPKGHEHHHGAATAPHTSSKQSQ